jgi:hypothetical protein
VENNIEALAVHAIAKAPGQILKLYISRLGSTKSTGECLERLTRGGAAERTESINGGSVRVRNHKPKAYKTWKGITQSQNETTKQWGDDNKKRNEPSLLVIIDILSPNLGEDRITAKTSSGSAGKPKAW